MSKATDNRSPLKVRPLRHAGQSMDEEITRLFDEDVLPYYFVAVLLVVLAGFEWWRSYSGSPPLPWFFTSVAVVAVALAAWKVVRVLRTVRNLKLGRDGERVMGQFLETLRAQGFRVFHDIPGDGFNVDHLIVGSKGVFTIETKTLSKPLRGESKIAFDGDEITIGGYQPDRNPIVQARAQAAWVRDLVFETTGRRISVHPVVVYPGWFVEGPPKGAKSDVWVLNPKALPAFIEHERDTLTTEDMSLICDRIARHVRDH